MITPDIQKIQYILHTFWLKYSLLFQSDIKDYEQADVWVHLSSAAQ